MSLYILKKVKFFPAIYQHLEKIIFEKLIDLLNQKELKSNRKVITFKKYQKI